MSKAVILKTDRGVMITGAWQCSNGTYFDAEGCYQYCNGQVNDFWNEHQTRKLLYEATTLGHRPKQDKDWYKNRENFIDVDIPYNEVEQEFSYEDII